MTCGCLFVYLCFDRLVHKGSLVFTHCIVQSVRSPNMSLCNLYDAHLYSVCIVWDQLKEIFKKINYEINKAQSNKGAQVRVSVFFLFFFMTSVFEQTWDFLKKI